MDTVPGLEEEYISFRELRVFPASSTSTTVPPKDGKVFQYAEHTFLGDQLELKLEDGLPKKAENVPLRLPNGLELTYGQINGLAGDFYGTGKPISDGIDDADRATRFQAAWNQLAEDKNRQPWEANNLLTVLKVEVDALNKAINAGEDPSKAYSQLSTIWATTQYQYFTITRPTGYPDYLGLAKINWDHFGEDARTAYNTGHRLALEYAASPNSDLHLAYGMNAFADHYLEDSFSAGHLRTPRRALHGNSSLDPADLCAKYMHDEDCAIGLSVTNPNGDNFVVYGDSRLLDKDNMTNRWLCLAALQESANEIYDAYCDKQVKQMPYKSWKYAPTLESSRAWQKLAPLFRFPEDGSEKPPRRKHVERREEHKYITDYGYLTTTVNCKSSGKWKYPMAL